MNVKQLIEALSKYPPDAIVMVVNAHHPDNGGDHLVTQLCRVVEVQNASGIVFVSGTADLAELYLE